MSSVFVDLYRGESLLSSLYTLIVASQVPPTYLILIISEHVPIPKGRHRGVTVVRSHHGVLVSAHGTGGWEVSGRLSLSPIIEQK